MKIEFRKVIDHTNADTLSRSNFWTYTSYLMGHEEAREQKPKTRVLNAVEETIELIWHKSDEEIR